MEETFPFTGYRDLTIEGLTVQAVAFMWASNQRQQLTPSLELAGGVSGSRSFV
jgi:hypothetical protein